MTSRTLKRVDARNRNALDPAVPARKVPAVIDSIATTAADTIQLTFDTRVQKSKLPGFTAASGVAVVTAATVVSDTVIELTFDRAVQGTDMTVPESDPGIRTGTGGFVPAGTYALPSFP